jgi:lysine biosynthesis protein LysW
MAKGYCIECEATLNLGKAPHKGQRISCFKCGADLEVVGLSPIELDWAYDEEEVWDTDDYDYDVDYDYEGEFEG